MEEAARLFNSESFRDKAHNSLENPDGEEAKQQNFDYIDYRPDYRLPTMYLHTYIRM